MLSRSTVYDLMHQYSFFKNVVKSKQERYYDYTTLFLVQTLRSIPYLRNSQTKTLLKIAYSMKSDFLEPGQVLHNEGDRCNCLVIIKHGVVEVV